MKKSLSIKNFMLKDHGEINGLLAKLKTSHYNSEADVIFIDFKNRLEKHITLEEQAIFSFSKFFRSDEQKIVHGLVDEHQAILKMIKDLAGQGEQEFKSKFLQLDEALKKHIFLENNFLYPQLDEQLDSRQKGFVMDKLLAGASN